MDFGSQLKKKVRKARIKKTELADAVGVSTVTITNWMENRTTPNTTTAMELCRALGVGVGIKITGEKIVFVDN